MVQDQLVEYISSQLKAGVSADAVKTALVGAGWQAADVDDTMKKVQSPAAVSAAASPAASIASLGGVVAQSQPAQKPVIQPQVIRVSDLVSSSPSGSSVGPKPMGSTMSSSVAKTDAVMSRIAAGGRPAGTGSFTASSSGATTATMAPAKKSRALATESILGILMIIFAAAAAFLFFENQGLSSQVTSVNGQSGSVASQIASLQQELSASTTALEAQIASTTAQNASLALDLSFYVVPPSSAPATTTFTTSLMGIVSGGGKNSYVITAPDGTKVTVSNSKDANVVALMDPLVGVTTTIGQFAGNYVPGVASIALTAVDGQSTTPPPAEPTSTATSSATSAAMPASPATTTSSAMTTTTTVAHGSTLPAGR